MAQRSSDTHASPAKLTSTNGTSKQERQSAGNAEKPTAKAKGGRKESGTKTTKAGSVKEWPICHRSRLQAARQKGSDKSFLNPLLTLHRNDGVKRVALEEQ